MPDQQSEEPPKDEEFYKLLSKHFGYSAPASRSAQFPEALKSRGVANEFWVWFQDQVVNEKLGPEEWGRIVGANIGREIDPEKQKEDWKSVGEELREVWKLSHEATGRPVEHLPAFPFYDGRHRAVADASTLPGSASDLFILNPARTAMGRLPSQGPRPPLDPPGPRGPQSPRQ
ncbi:MAG: hypothetical protein HOQ05_14125 [Corynebacteriales bacterium]|nr:hypothetical protein [Mycobacteriales bacterium]